MKHKRGQSEGRWRGTAVSDGAAAGRVLRIHTGARDYIYRVRLDDAEVERMTAVITSNRDRWVEFMLAEEYGLARQIRSAMKAALTTFASFFLCGSIPLVAFGDGYHDGR